MSDTSFVDAVMRLLGMADHGGFADALSLADIPAEHLTAAGIDLHNLSTHEIRLLEEVISDYASGPSAGAPTIIVPSADMLSDSMSTMQTQPID